MPANYKELQRNLDRKFKAVFNMPKSRIDFPFFVAIYDYIKLIEKDQYLRGLIYGCDKFGSHAPLRILVKKGRDIKDTNFVFKNQKMPELLTAYFNLYAVYLGIKDLDNHLVKNDMTENRFKMAQQLGVLRDDTKVFPKGYFWDLRSKYYGWIRIVNNQLLSLMEADQQAQIAKEIKEAKKLAKMKSIAKSEVINEVEKPAEIAQSAETKIITEANSNPNISYRHDIPNKLAWFTFNGKELEFKGTRSLVFHFFYLLNQVNDNGYKTVNDFNNFLIANGVKEIDSVSFRQIIDNINKRVKNELKGLTSVIKLKAKNKPKDINCYQWKMEI